MACIIGIEIPGRTRMAFTARSPAFSGLCWRNLAIQPGASVISEAPTATPIVSNACTRTFATSSPSGGRQDARKHSTRL